MTKMQMQRASADLERQRHAPLPTLRQKLTAELSTPRRCKRPCVSRAPSHSIQPPEKEFALRGTLSAISRRKLRGMKEQTRSAVSSVSTSLRPLDRKSVV